MASRPRARRRMRRIPPRSAPPPGGTPVSPPTTLAAHLHAGHHHQRIRLIEVFADGQQSVQPGHAHIADRVDLGAEHPSGRGGFRGDGQIRGTGADDQDLSDSFWKRTEHSGTADGIEADLRKAVLQCAGGAVVHPVASTARSGCACCNVVIMWTVWSGDLPCANTTSGHRCAARGGCRRARNRGR